MLIQARHARRAFLALTSGCFVLAAAAHVQAGEEEGFGLLFQNFFGSRSTPVPQSEPTPAVQPLPVYGSGVRDDYGHRHWTGRQSARRAWLREPRAQNKPAPKARYAALPRPEKVREKVEKATPKPQVADNAALALAKAGDPGAALLKDPTLRRGDIVITAAGAKVFTGKAGDQHRTGDFEEASRSASLDRKTRKLLAAMVAPAGALPTEEARRVLARMRNGPADASAPTQLQARVAEPVVRVVYPGAVLNAAAGPD